MLDKTQMRVGRWPAGVITAVVLVDQVDTNVVAGALPSIQREFGFGDTAAGAIPATVAIASLALALPAGQLADRVVRTRMISTVVAGWSVITMMSAAAISFPMFFLTRVVLAGADSIYGPAASSLLADYYEPRRRGRVYAAYSLAAFVGLALGVAVGGVVSSALGWRAAFLVTVVPGLVVAVLVRRLREPSRGARDEATIVDANAAPAPEPIDGRFVARLRQVLGYTALRRLVIAHALVYLGVSGVFFWLPSFLERVDDLGEGLAAAVAAVVILVGTVIGTIVGGRTGDRLAVTRRSARLQLSSVGLLGAGAIALPTLLLPGLAVHVLGLGIAATLAGLAIPNLPAQTTESTPAEVRGLAFALTSLASAVGGAVGPFVVGVVSDLSGSLAVGLAPTAILLAAAGLVLRPTGQEPADIRMPTQGLKT